MHTTCVRPLSRLRQRLETARSGKGDDDARLDLLDRALLEADGLLKTFNALLRIARIESEPLQSTFDEVDLKGLLHDVVELYEPVAEQKSQLIDVADANTVRVNGDRDLLFQALANLFDNAIKYSPESSTIYAKLSATSLELCDSGPGVDVSEREKVFQRFYRADASRSTEGSGLGLSLVKAVVELHRMDIELSDMDPGLCVTLSFGSQVVPAPSSERTTAERKGH